MPDRTLTAEQRAILQHEPHRTALVQAFAGTGKTSTLVAYAEAWQREPALYLAFNTAIAREAQGQFPSHVEARTGHSLAFRTMSVGAHHERLTKSLRTRDLEHALASVGMRSPNQRTIQGLRRMLRRHLIGDEALPRIPEVWSKDAEVDWEAVLAAVDAVLSFENSGLPFTHDVYFKRMALAGHVPRGVGYIMVDEAQDMNPVMIGWLRRTRLPLLVVGDPWQSIYAFRGAVSAMEAFDAPIYPLTQSWRFGGVIAKAASGLLSHVSRPPRQPVRGHPGRASRITSVDRAAGRKRLVLARSNAGAFEAVLGSGDSFYIEGGFDAFAAPLLAAVRLRFGGARIDGAGHLDYASWSDLVAEALEGDAEATRLMALVERYGDSLPSLLDRLRSRHVSRLQAMIHLSTAHKAKGLESDEVEMLDDFPSLESLAARDSYARETSKSIDPIARDQEIHLLYVAVTRAKSVLYAPSWIGQVHG